MKRRMMFPAWYKFLFISMICLAGIAPAVAQPAPTVIWGYVTYTDDTPVSNLCVTITNPDTFETFPVKTNATSNYYRAFIDSTRLHAGDRILINATDGTCCNVTEHIITRDHIGSGEFTQNLTLAVSIEPDLVIVDAFLEWIDKRNRTYSVTYTVTNHGGDANESTTAITIDGNTTLNDSVPALATGDSYTSTAGPFAMSDRCDTVTVCVDGDEVIDESNETNNCFESVFEYLGMPDLVVVEISKPIWIDFENKTYTFKTIEAATVQTPVFTVKNIGDAKANHISYLSIIIDGEMEGTHHTSYRKVNETQGIPHKDEPAVGKFTMSGNYDTIRICADCYDNVYEINETNNCLEHVFGIPDLVITEIKEEWVKIGETYNVTYTVTNIGYGYADASTSDIWRDGDIPINDSVKGLNVSESVARTVGPFKISDDSDTIVVRADHKKEVYETNEDNNCLENVFGLPDLAATDMSPEWLNQEKTRYRINYTVKNIGYAGYAESDVINVSITIDETEVANKSLKRLNASEHYTATIGPFDLSDGIDTIQICIDDEGAVTELNEDNNCLLKELGLPDLMITDYSAVWVNPEHDAYNITYTVENIGDGDANESRIIIKYPYNEENDYFKYDLVGPLNSGESHTGIITIPWRSDDEPCANIKIYADYPNTVKEYNEDNNDISFNFGLPDLVVENKSGTWVDKRNKTYNIIYTVKNRGYGGYVEDVDMINVAIVIDGTEVANEPIRKLNESENYTGTIGCFVMSGENDTIRICADSEGVITEFNETNNCSEDVFEYPGMSDLVIVNKSEEWADLSNNTYNITYTVKNIGDANASASNTSIERDGDISTDSVRSLYVNESVTHTIGPFTMLGDSDRILICADVDDAVEEYTETNNCAENEFWYPVMPDLVIVEKSEEWVDRINRTYNVTYTVKNMGIEANESNATITIDGNLTQSDLVPALAPGKRHTSTAGPFNLSGASDTITVCSDTDDDVNESNEDNNCIENEIAGKPDLVITEKKEEWVVKGTKTYNITYTIANIGIAEANATITDIYINGQLVANNSVPKLNATENYTATIGTFNMSIPDKSDTIRVCIDANNDVCESDEDNNCIENVFEYHPGGCVADDIIYFCGDTVTKSCRLDGDMLCHEGGYGLVIGADNIEIDGAGFAISGNATNCSEDVHCGIFCEYDNVTVRNLGIDGFCTGIDLVDARNCTLSDNTIFGNIGAGIVSSGDCSDSRIVKNEIKENGGEGIRTSSTSENWTIKNNDIGDNAGHGILVDGSRHTIRYNMVTGCENGIFFSSYAKDNTIVSNTVCGNTGRDIFDVNPSNGNFGRGNTCNTTTNYDDEGTTGCTYTCPGEMDLVITDKHERWVKYGYNLIHPWPPWDIYGSTYNVVYTVTNAGNSTIGVTRTGIYINDNLNKTDRVHAIGSGESYTGTVGPFRMSANTSDTIRVCADNDYAVKESNETNNRLENEFEGPDMIVAGISPKWGDMKRKKYKLLLTVKNIGDGYSGGFASHLYIDGVRPPSGGLDFPQHIQPGQSRTMTYGQMGGHHMTIFTMSGNNDTFKVCLDPLGYSCPRGNLFESNDTNNCLEVVFNYPADLEIVDTSEEWVVYGVNYTVAYTVENTGGESANASTTAIIIDGNATLNDSSPELAPGERYTGTLGPFDVTGDYDAIRVCADSRDIIDEAREDNNCRDSTFGLAEKPDLKIVDTMGDWVVTGETYTITYTVRNTGNGYANESNASITIDNLTLVNDSVPDLAQGQSYTRILGPFDVTDEIDTIRICADSNDAVTEYIETNNCLNCTFGLPRLVFADLSPRWADFENKTYNVTYTVANVGGSITDPAMEDGVMFTMGCGGYSDPLDPLEPSESYTNAIGPFHWSPPYDYITAGVGHGYRWSRFCCRFGLPDLVVADKYEEFDSTGDNKYNITFTVTNIGYSGYVEDVDEINVSVEIDGEKVANITIGRLEGGWMYPYWVSESNTTTIGPFNLTDGTDNISICVDNEGAVTELNEDNNCLENVCGGFADEDGTLYRCGDITRKSCGLLGSLKCPPGHGLIIGADDIVIDGAGFALIGDDSACPECDASNPNSTYCGILNYEEKVHHGGMHCEWRSYHPYDNVVIKNLTLSNFCNGIAIREARNNTIDDCKVHHNGYGITVVASNNITIDRCEVYNNTGTSSGHGINLLDSDYCNVRHSNVFHNHLSGIFASYTCDHLFIYNNSLENNGCSGESAHLCAGINLHSGEGGLRETYSIVEENNISNTTGPGIYVAQGYIAINNNTVRRSKNGKIIGVSGHGIHFHGAEHTFIYNNTFCDNEGADISNEEGGAGNCGDENTCDFASGYNDTGTIRGCIYQCAGCGACVADDNSNDTYCCGDTVLKSCTFNGSLDCRKKAGGLVIGADDVTIDGDGFTLTGSSNGSGVLSNHKNAAIKNLQVKDFYTGIRLENASCYNTIENCYIRRNDRYGIHFDYTAENNTINSSTVYGNPVDIRNDDGLSNTGHENTCDVTFNYNDTGTTMGCTYTWTRPDLVIVSKSEEWVDSKDTTYQVTYTIKNIGDPGSRESGNSTTYLYIENHSVATDPVGSLKRGENYTATFNYTAKMSGESDLITVCADGGGVVPESDEENNCLGNLFDMYEAGGGPGVEYDPYAACVGETQNFTCGDTVTESCTFSGNMYCSGWHGLVIGGSGITIDGGGHTLGGPGTASCNGDGTESTQKDPHKVNCGILNLGHDNVVLKNLDIIEFCNGIGLRGTTGDRVIDNEIYNCNIYLNGNANNGRSHGIHLCYVEDCTIKNNIVHHNKGAGPYCSDGGNGIFVYSGENIGITGNKLYNNRKAGLFTKMGFTGSRIADNTILRNGQGGIILRGGSPENRIEENYVSENYGDGIFIGSAGNILYNNIVIDNIAGHRVGDPRQGEPEDGDGIDLGRSESKGNMLDWNTICGNEGIDVNTYAAGLGTTGSNNACDTHGVEFTGCTISCQNASKPDLVIVDMTEEWVDQREGTFDISYTIMNIGNADARIESRTNIYINNHYYDPFDQVEPLNVNKSETRTVGSFLLPGGVTNITARADGGLVIDESDEDNNYCNSTFGLPDLNITDVKPEFIDEERYKINFTVKNKGYGYSPPCKVSITIDGAIVENVGIGRLNATADSTKTVSRSHTITKGNDIIEVCADLPDRENPDGYVKEIDEYNNKISIAVTAQSLHNISVTPAEATLKPDETQAFTATALNQYGGVVNDIAIAWSSINPTVGDVCIKSGITDEDGNTTTIFMAGAKGTTIITAEDGTITGTATVTVGGEDPPGGPGPGGHHPGWSNGTGEEIGSEGGTSKEGIGGGGEIQLPVNESHADEGGETIRGMGQLFKSGGVGGSIAGSAVPISLIAVIMMIAAVHFYRGYRSEMKMYRRKR
jgi:parallel beta-helix repeat protein